MSEPTGGEQQQPDPDPGTDPDEVQDEVPDSVFSDPTAPVWADPTTPILAPPTPPGAAHPEGDQPSASPQMSPPAAPPVSNPYAQVSNPYAQQPPAQPYAEQPPPPYGQQPPPPYGQQPPQQYGQSQPATQYPAYGQQSYATGQQPETNGSAIVLTVLSGLSLLVANILAVAPLILGIVALTKNTMDHEGSVRMTKIGWIFFAVSWAIGILVAIGLVILFAVTLRNGDSGTSSGF